MKQVIVVRKDLNMRKGKMCAQVAHASMKVFFDRIIGNKIDDDLLVIGPLQNNIFEWINGSFIKIVVGCDTINNIYEIEQKCIDYDIVYSIIKDNGTTEFNGVPTITCIAVGPDDSEKIDLITKEYKLL